MSYEQYSVYQVKLVYYCFFLCICRSSNRVFSSIIFSLKLRAETMKPNDRDISCVIDEMSLKHHLEYDRNSDIVYGMKNGKLLNQALVIMARGLANK